MDNSNKWFGKTLDKGKGKECDGSAALDRAGELGYGICFEVE